MHANGDPGGTLRGRSEGYEHLLSKIPAWIDTLEPNVAARMVTGRDAKVSDYLGALRQVERLWGLASERLGAVDVLAVPTVPITPPTVDEVQETDAYVAKNMAALSSTMAVNSLDLCAVTIPAGLDGAGMPVGLQLIAKAHSEENLLAVALAVEKVLGAPVERLGRPPLGGSN